jgi:ABC-type Na+ transport system ATPase subunit NatA
VANADMVRYARRTRGQLGYVAQRFSLYGDLTVPENLKLQAGLYGTTSAVAHKMGRRWIMVELGEHCHTHIIPRLRKVMDGEEQGEISKAVSTGGAAAGSATTASARP